ncbi:putative sulfate exporter family transporter [Bosea caraganae]|uniref:Putative sulfate exporter family transporter n=1 Tax=Bosea caraganae TaxID=2763117 RepID=A0A370L1K7_9HYPH|nr:putative sulfate exporter family transporter [Bosea caraganae]RDJ21484.1 putative sulfate exporter family transporter [Bosea caraganae]RDJ23452.1 putative sulfate exporter family transporter [Bosea caraganae]
MTAATSSPLSAWRPLVDGIVLSVVVAIASDYAEPALKTLLGSQIGIPSVVIALVLGMLLHPLANAPRFVPGMSFCVKKLLRWAIALLGLRIALGDIIALGLSTALLVVAGMALTVVSGFLLARWLGRESGTGALAGVATAVCGASAALATATVVPDYKGKSADVAFTVIAMNALSTLAMLGYPLICVWLGLNAQQTGIMLGATIHDVAQVVGAGQSVSDEAANAAVIVKLFRVFMLLPAVLIVGWWLARDGAGKVGGHAKVPVPVFAIVFLALCLLNSVLAMQPALAGIYPPIRAGLLEASRWGLLIAIAALGLGTSIAAMARLGWRHLALVTGTSLVILVVVTGGLLALG